MTSRQCLARPVWSRNGWTVQISGYILWVMHDNKVWRRCDIGLLAFVSLPRVVKHPKYQNELFSQITLMSWTAAGAMSTFRLGNGFTLFIWTLHLLHLLLMTEWNPPISNRSVPSPLHHMQKDPKYENEPPCLHPLAASCCFLQRKLFSCKGCSGFERSPGLCALGKGPVVRAGVSQTAITAWGALRVQWRVLSTLG